jgi:hypothetical protein
MSIIRFTASSTSAKNVGAHVNVIVDGKKIGSTFVGSKVSTYSFNMPKLAAHTAHDVRIVYNNDTVINGQDRNLLLKSITVDGKTVSATNSHEVYHAPGQGNLASDGNMYWKGTAEFKLPASMFPGSTPKPPPHPATRAFYVSTTGSDSGNGSAAHPFATLTKALSAMENSNIHTTYLKGGTYHLGSTVDLGKSASGMTFASAPGAKAVLDGGGSLNTLIQLDGASKVTLRGLTFQNTNPSSRAAVVLNGASNNAIVGNHFLNNGEGLLLNNGSSHNTVSGNELNNSHSSAIEVQDGSSYNRLDSNLINGTGAIGTQGGGFFLHGASNNMISHNVVENTAGIGIGVENWDDHTINVGNAIIDNVVKNTNTSSQSTDSGAIYELGRSQVDTKSVINGNYISGPNTAASSGSHIVGIYLDDYADGVKVVNNIVTDIVTHGLQIHGGSNITAQNNIFDLGSTGKSAILFQSTGASVDGTPHPMTNDVIKSNIIASSSSSPAAFSNISGGSPTIGDNFYMDMLNSHFQMGGFNQTDPHYGNARFGNQAGGNYHLASGSPALAAGFHDINQNVMGLHPATNHWYA